MNWFTMSRKKMKKTGAELVRYALEQLGIEYTFGIPGVHTTEIYDQLNSSSKVQPILVTHECGGAFMADAVSRTGRSIGILLIVPAAGITHAASGIGEAGLDGIPMLIISGGVHSESGHKYQLHDIDQHTLLKPLTKASFKILSHKDVIPTFYQAYQLANDGEPGPVYIEIPYNVANFKGVVDELPEFKHQQSAAHVSHPLINQAIELIQQSQHIGIFAGWGARDATQELIELAEYLAAPVATTLQGLSVFPADHPLHTGMGFGDYSVPAAQKAFEEIDCLIAIGTRFSEIATGSYGIKVPSKLIHIDINSEVFNANYPAAIAIAGDAQMVLSAINQQLKQVAQKRNAKELTLNIQKQKEAYLTEWLNHETKDKVNPALFFKALRAHMGKDSFVVTDDGNHTFLAAELMPIHKSRGFISPSDFNAMGYCVPAAIGTKLANPQKKVAGIVGDGGFLMTGLELLTATRLQLGVVIFVFNDGELAQIAQAQKIPYNRKTCTQISGFKPEGIAIATGAKYILMKDSSQIESTLTEAFDIAANGYPVVVDIHIDYSKPTRFTQGVVKTNLSRFSHREKIRAVTRAIFRRLAG
jgi:acetolactate synthase-1/2/3 large subunit